MHSVSHKWDNEKIEFQDLFVFVNFLEELNRNKWQHNT